MKSQLIAIVLAVLVVGCSGPPEPPDISIHDAAAKGNIEAVKQHLAAGTDVNARISMGAPLHKAVTGGHKEIAELLIANGAEVNAQTNAGMTPLSLANVFDETEIADLLRKHGGKTKSEL